MLTIHDLKIWPEYFKAIVQGYKTFEIRKNDRDYKVGDILDLKEYDPKTQQYTGRNTLVKVTYIMDKQPYVPLGYVCMGIVNVVKTT